MHHTIVQFTEARRLFRGQPMLTDPRATAFRLSMFADKLDPWQAIFCRDLPQQSRPVSVRQCAALQAIVEELAHEGCRL
jgi:hypothetical protein